MTYVFLALECLISPIMSPQYALRFHLAMQH